MQDILDEIYAESVDLITFLENVETIDEMDHSNVFNYITLNFIKMVINLTNRG